VGVLARSVDDAAFFIGVLARADLATAPSAGLRVGMCQTPNWDRASGDARRAFTEAGRLFGHAGARVQDVQESGAWAGLTQAQIDIMGYEALGAFAPERRTHAGLFSAAFAAFLEAALSVDGRRFADAQQLAEQARAELATLFRTVDVLVAPSSEGEAPAGLEATGNPVFNRMWTLLGVPCVHVPLGVGTTGLPVGVTVIAPRWSDALALAAAAELERGARAAGMGG
jgi:amidase